MFVRRTRWLLALARARAHPCHLSSILLASCLSRSPSRPRLGGTRSAFVGHLAGAAAGRGAQAWREVFHLRGIAFTPRRIRERPRTRTRAAQVEVRRQDHHASCTHGRTHGLGALLEPGAGDKGRTDGAGGGRAKREGKKRLGERKRLEGPNKRAAEGRSRHRGRQLILANRSRRGGVRRRRASREEPGIRRR